MKHRKTQLAVAVGAALVAGAAQAQAPAPVTPAQPLTVQLYGQISRALMFADDGHQSKWFHVDAQPSSTRFGINAAAQAMPGLRIGGRIEAEMKSNPSDTVNFGGAGLGPGPTTGAGGSLGGATSVAFAERWLDAFFEGAWGRVNLGQGSGAADDASTLDLSGTNMPNGNCVSDWGGGIVYRLSTGGVLTTGVTPTTVVDSYNCQDFESRYDRVMYTTPVFGGFRGQVGWGQKSADGEVFEASVWFAGKVAGDLQAAFGYSKEKLATPATATAQAGPDNETIGGSVSWLHTSGFNVTLGFTQMKHGGATGLCTAATCPAGSTIGSERDEVQSIQGKIGYRFGQHAIAVDYGQVTDRAAQGDEAKSYGVGYTWFPARWAEIFATYRIFQMDRDASLLPVGTSIEDVTVGAIGTRIRF